LFTVKSEIKTNEPRNPPAIVNGWLDANWLRKTCNDANNNKATRSENKNDVEFDEAKVLFFFAIRSLSSSVTSTYPLLVVCFFRSRNEGF